MVTDWLVAQFFFLLLNLSLCTYFDLHGTIHLEKENTRDSFVYNFVAFAFAFLFFLLFASFHFILFAHHESWCWCCYWCVLSATTIAPVLNVTLLFCFIVFPFMQDKLKMIHLKMVHFSIWKSVTHFLIFASLERTKITFPNCTHNNNNNNNNFSLLPQHQSHANNYFTFALSLILFLTHRHCCMGAMSLLMTHLSSGVYFLHRETGQKGDSGSYSFFLFRFFSHSLYNFLQNACVSFSKSAISSLQLFFKELMDMDTFFQLNCR